MYSGIAIHNRRPVISARIILAGCLLLGGNAMANEFHPVFPLLDKAGQPVIESGRPLSTIKSCGACHDTSFITSTSDHADAGAAQLGSENSRYEWQAGPGYFGGWDPLRYDSALTEEGRIDVKEWLRQSGARHVGGGPVSDLIEMDCLLCHSDLTDPAARRDSLQRGDYRWANSSSLSQNGILLESEGQWIWNPDKFQDDGTLVEGALNIRKPRDENCARATELSITDWTAR